MRRFNFVAFTAIVMMGFLTTASASRAEDVGQKLAPVGKSIKKGAEDTGAAIEKAAKDIGTTIKEKTEPVGETVKKTAENAGPKIEQGAKDTGSYLDQATKNFRDGAQAFFQKVGNFFSGK